MGTKVVVVLGLFFLLLFFPIIARCDQTMIVDLQPIAFSCQPVAAVKASCRLTVKNVGTLAYLTMNGQESVQVDIPGLATEPQKTSCNGTGTLVVGRPIPTPPGALAPNSQADYAVDLTIPQSGQFDIKITLSIGTHGPFFENNLDNNVLNTTVNVSLPKPVICSVERTPGNIKQFGITGLWFMRPGSQDSINVTFGSQSTKAEVSSSPAPTPFSLTAASSEVFPGCVSPGLFKVSNATGSSDPFQAPLPPPTVAGMSPNPKFLQPFQLKGTFQSGCPITVVLTATGTAPIRLNTSSTSNGVSVTLPAGHVTTVFAVSVETTYGTAKAGEIKVSP